MTNIDPWDPPQTYFIRCPTCDAGVGAVAVGHVDYDDRGLPLNYRAVLARCEQCREPILLGQTDVGEGWDDLVRLWPEADLPLNSAIPKELRDEHWQARLCFQAKAFTACVVMIRRTLEGVCILNEIKSRNLNEGLNKLRQTGKLDERLFEWANALRALGNEGAHYTGKQVSREVALDALQFCEALLDNMYVLTERFEAFKQRRSGESSPPEPEPTGLEFSVNT